MVPYTKDLVVEQQYVIPTRVFVALEAGSIDEYRVVPCFYILYICTYTIDPH